MKLKNFVRLLITPTVYLGRLGTYSPELDRRINTLMDSGVKPQFDDITCCTALLGNLTLWVGNFPYFYAADQHTRMHPSWDTIFRVKDALDGQCGRRNRV